jgi:hypothetical protein
MEDEGKELPCGEFISLEDIMACCCDDGADPPDIIRLLSGIPFIIAAAVLLELDRMLELLFAGFRFCDFLTVSRTGPQAGQAGSLHFR